MGGLPDAGLVGREQERAALVKALDRGLAGQPGLVVVCGEAGIGKTALVEDLSTTAVARGASVVRGGAEERHTAAFGVWLAPSYQLGIARAERDDSLPPDERRWEFLDELTAALQAAGRALLVLEDLQWADEMSLWTLAHLTQGLMGWPVAVVATCREGAPESRVLTELRPGTVVRLRGLTSGEVTRLAAELCPDRPVDAETLRGRTGGNPLFIREVLAAGDRLPRVPPVVGEVLGRVLRELDLPSQRLLAALALVGADTPRAVLARALDLPLGDLQRCVEETLAAGILVAQPPAAPRFRHDLLADSAIDLLGRDGERELQRRLAASWDGVPSSAATRARAAASLVAAVPLVDADEAVAAAQRAASLLAATGDHATAARLLGAAAEALSIHGLNVPSATSAVLVDLGEARAALGDSRGAEEAFEAAAASKPTDVEVRARAECGAARHINLFADDPARRRRLAEADDALPPGDHPIRAALLGRRAVAAMARTDLLPEASRLADEAVIMARRLGDLTVLATATIDRHLITTTGTDLERADNEADELSRLGETSGRADLVLVADQWRYATCVSRGDLRAARAVLDRYEVLASLMPSPEWRYTALLRRSTQSLLDGDRDNALGFLDEAVPLGREALPEGEACGLEHALRTLTVRLTGVPDPSLAELHAEFEDHVRNIPVAFFQVHLACSDLALGRTNAATKIVDRWAADPSNLGGGRQRPALLATLGALVADLALTNHASDMRRALEAFSGLYIPEPGFGVDLPVDDALGRLALLDGDVDVAIVYLERALSVAIALPSPVVEARCRQHLGDAYIAAGDAARGDAARREAALLADRVGILLPGAVVPAESRPPSPAARLRRAGKTWVISAPHGAAEVLHSAGMDQLAKILAAAPQEVAAVELARPGIPVAADLGSIIDATAKRAYRRRITELRADIDEADADNDVERAARARVELDTLMDQLRQAVGIGGRDRPNRSGTERARINVARAVRRAINSISQALPELGAHLQTSIRTGRFCSYRPEPATALDWTVEY